MSVAVVTVRSDTRVAAVGAAADGGAVGWRKADHLLLKCEGLGVGRGEGGRLQSKGEERDDCLERDHVVGNAGLIS